MVSGDDEGEEFFHLEFEADEVGETQAGVATGAEDALHIADAEAGDAEEQFAGGFVDVDREGLAVAESPGEFGVECEVEIGSGGRGDFVDFEIVEAEEPIGLVEAVFADEGWGLQRENGGGFGDGAEGGVVDAFEVVLGVEFVGAAEDGGVG